MGKYFVYFLQTDGGMDVIYISHIKDLRQLSGWMNDECVWADQELLRWMETAEVGEIKHHRMGCLVRTLKDYRDKNG